MDANNAIEPLNKVAEIFKKYERPDVVKSIRELQSKIEEQQQLKQKIRTLKKEVDEGLNQIEDEIDLLRFWFELKDL